MFSRRALALVAASLLLVATFVTTPGCNSRAAGHETSRTRDHNFKVENFTHETVVVYVGDDSHNIGDVGDEGSSFYWIIPGTYHVTLVAEAGSIDYGSVTFGTSSCFFAAYNPPFATFNQEPNDDESDDSSSEDSSSDDGSFLEVLLH